MPFGSSESLSHARGTRLLKAWLEVNQPAFFLFSSSSQLFPVLGCRGWIYWDVKAHLNQDAASEYYEAVTRFLTCQPLCHQDISSPCSDITPDYQHRVPLLEQPHPRHS